MLSVKSDDIVDDTLIIAYDLLPEEQEAPIDDEQGNGILYKHIFLELNKLIIFSWT